jgi:hypothetical protein
MRKLAILALALLAGGVASRAEEDSTVSSASALQVVLSRKPFWITTGTAMAPLGGWGIVRVDRPEGAARPLRVLVQGTLFETRFESYDVTNVQGLAIYPAGQLLFRDRFAKMERRGTVDEALRELEPYHDALRRFASEAIRGGALEEKPPEVLRTAVDSAAGTLLVRYGFQPTRQADPHGEWHHVDAVVFFDLGARTIERVHVFGVPLE